MLNSFEFNSKLILPVYSAGEKKIKGINSDLIVNNTKNTKLTTEENLVQDLTEKENDVVVFLGAGNIHKIAQETFNYSQIN